MARTRKTINCTVLARKNQYSNQVKARSCRFHLAPCGITWYADRSRCETRSNRRHARLATVALPPWNFGAEYFGNHDVHLNEHDRLE